MAEPRPAAADDDLAGIARGLRDELHQATRWRRIKAIAWSVFATTFIVVAVIFGLYIYSNRATAHQAQATANHLAAAVACQDAYDQRLATILQARAAASQRQTAALQTLIGEVLAVKSPRQFRADVQAWQRAVRAAEKIPVPPLPPPACR